MWMKVASLLSPWACVCFMWRVVDLWSHRRSTKRHICMCACCISCIKKLRLKVAQHRAALEERWGVKRAIFCTFLPLMEGAQWRGRQTKWGERVIAQQKSLGKRHNQEANQKKRRSSWVSNFQRTPFWCLCPGFYSSEAVITTAMRSAPPVLATLAVGLAQCYTTQATCYLDCVLYLISIMLDTCFVGSPHHPAALRPHCANARL